MRPINLLPKELTPDGRRIPLILAGTVLVWLLVVGLATVAAQGRADDAEEVNRRISVEIDGLTRQVQDLSVVQDRIDQYQAGADLLTSLLAGDVSWGRIMTDLSTEIPSRVWLEAFSGSTQTGENSPYGQITMNGVAFDFPDVSEWIRTLDATEFPGVAGAWVQSVSESTIGEAHVVLFSSTTSLTEDALSGRILTRVPEVR